MSVVLQIENLSKEYRLGLIGHGTLYRDLQSLWAKILNKEERDSIEDWAWEVFHVLLFNLVSPDQKKHIYAEVGIDWQWAQSIMMETATDENLREEMLEATNIFRVLVKTLLKAGIITERTAGNYAAFVDIQELYKEGDWMVGDDIAEEGIKQLIRINGGSNKFLSLDSLVAAE